MAQFDVHVSKKPKLDEFDINRCIFCSGPFSKTAAGKIQAVSPDLTKLDSLFSACRARNDTLGEKLLMQEEKIRDGNITFRYHRNCRSTYVSPLHVQRAQQKSAACTLGNKGNDSGDVSSGGTESSLTRSKCSMSSFEWKEKCFICGERCSPKHRGTWSMVESAIDDKSKNMYTKLLEVAELREDEEMLLRLRGVPHGDLVAIEARYHRKKGCYTRYVSYRNISASVNQSKIDNAYLKAIRNLVEEYRPAIIENKEVYLLTTLKERFLQLAIENGVDNPDSYKSFNLKRQLMQECPHLSFISQPGRSDLVCSNDISVGEAL